MGSGRRPPSAARAAAISLRPANTISLRSAKKLTTLPRNSSARKNRVKLLRENVERAVRENITTPARATGDRLMSTMDRMTATTDPLMSLRVSRKKLSATSKTQAQAQTKKKTVPVESSGGSAMSTFFGVVLAICIIGGVVIYAIRRNNAAKYNDAEGTSTMGHMYGIGANANKTDSYKDDDDEEASIKFADHPSDGNSAEDED